MDNGNRSWDRVWGEKDDQGRYVTALNGPMVRNDQRECNRTGFYVRKYLDKTTSGELTVDLKCGMFISVFLKLI